MSISIEWLIIIGLVVAAAGFAVYWFYFRKTPEQTLEQNCAALDAALQLEVNKSNGGDPAKIAEIRNNLNLNCRAPSSSQTAVTNKATGEVFLPFSVETECAALVTSYMAEYRALQQTKNDPTQGAAKGNHMRVLLGDIRQCYENSLTQIDETTINGFIESVKKAIQQITSTVSCFKSGVCQGSGVDIHGDNFINQDINPTLESLQTVKKFAEQRRKDLMEALRSAA